MGPPEAAIDQAPEGDQAPEAPDARTHESPRFLVSARAGGLKKTPCVLRFGYPTKVLKHRSRRGWRAEVNS